MIAPNLTPLGHILLFFVGWLGLWSVLAIPLSRRLGWRPFQPAPADQKLKLLLPLYLIAPLVIGIANRLLDQTWADQGIRGMMATVIDGATGEGIAIAGLSLLLLCKTRLGLVQLASPSAESSSGWMQKFSTLLGLLLLGGVIGGIEELVFRGWLQTQLENTLVPWGAAIAASAIFALAHLVWDGRVGLWQQPGLWLLGMVLVVARWADGGSIALAWGLHAGWVSGLAYIGEFLRPLPIAGRPLWLAGRVTQPLTDILDLTLLVITAVLIWRYSGFLATS